MWVKFGRKLIIVLIISSIVNKEGKDKLCILAGDANVATSDLWLVSFVVLSNRSSLCVDPSFFAALNKNGKSGLNFPLDWVELIIKVEIDYLRVRRENTRIFLRDTFIVVCNIMEDLS